MNSYDRLPYPNLSFAQTHPDRLATLATLLGMGPAPVERCRVLELGCAGGGNLLPMAHGLPGSEFVGIDASAVQIAAGQEAVAALGLENLSLRHMDILDVDESLGQFDYIIAHGVYSWVPPEVQDRILGLCRENLAPQGVAYVSYNTYPGWHMIEIARGIMLFEARGLEDPEARAAAGRAGLALMAELGPGDSSAYGLFLQDYARLINGQQEDALAKSNSLLYHDEMSDHNSPVYFYQFAERAAAHGLQYLGDLHPGSGDPVPPAVLDRLRERAHSQVELEQYLDLLQNRTFRQTLLCHDDVALSRTVKLQQATGFYAASRAEAVSPRPELRAVSVEQFRGHDGALLSFAHPVSKAAMVCLAEAWPRALSFGELLAAARARLECAGPSPGPAVPTSGSGEPQPVTEFSSDADAQVLAANLLKAFQYSRSLVELHSHHVPLACRAGNRPRTSAVVRYLARGDGLVTNLRHERLETDPLVRFLLPYLDGQHNRDDLLDLLLEGPVARGLLTVEQDGEPIVEVRELLAVELENCLAWAAGAALLLEPGGECQ